MAKVKVEVVYALAHKQRILTVVVDEGTSLFDAVQQSNITTEFPELNTAQAKLGLYGKTVAKPQEQAVKEGDRIEIYRPLIIDPKQARLNRAAKTTES